jgi:hypothetical protein
LTTVGSEHPTSSAIRSPGLPSAAHSTIRARSTILTSELAAPTIRSSLTRSASPHLDPLARALHSHR